jgi:hypothetical protein
MAKDEEQLWKQKPEMAGGSADSALIRDNELSLFSVLQGTPEMCQTGFYIFLKRSLRVEIMNDQIITKIYFSIGTMFDSHFI